MQRIAISTIMPALVIFAYIALIVFSPSVHFIKYIEFHDCQRVIQLLLLGLVLLDAVFIGYKKYNMMPISNNIKFGFFTLLTLAVASVAYSTVPRYAVIEITIFTALCYLALFVARLYGEFKEKLVQQLIYALWISIALYLVSFYTGYITAMIAKKPLEWPYPFYGFSNIRLFQQYQLWALGLICLPLITFKLKKNTCFLLYFALAFWWVLLFYAASRGVILGWLLAMIITATIYKKMSLPFLRIQLISAAAGLCLYVILFKLIPTQVSPTAVVTSTVFRDTVTDRTDLWKAAILMMKNFPFLGVGPMQFYFYTPFGTHPHNSVLQLGAEFGIPATLIMLTITAYCFHQWRRKLSVTQWQTTTHHNNSNSLAVILFFTVVANGAYSLVEGVIIMPISQVLMFTVIGLMIGQYTENTWLSTAAAKHPIKNKLRFRPIFAPIVLIFMILSTFPELERGLKSYNRILSGNERAFSMAADTINPRIWMQQRRKEQE